MNIGIVYEWINLTMGIGTLLCAIVLCVLWIPAVRKVAVQYRNLVTWLTCFLGLSLIVFPLIYEFGLGFAPCLMCWMQRVAVWPAVLISVIALRKRQLQLLAPYIYTLLGFGIVFALYHVSLQTGVTTSSVCEVSGGASCSTVDIIVFGFITMPVMSIVGQLLLGTCVSLLVTRE